MEQGEGCGLTQLQAAALRAVADEIAGFVPVASTFTGMTAIQGAKVTLRMVVDLIRERADGRPDTTRKATDDELAGAALLKASGGKDAA
jgi:hypothetical protein